MYAAAAGHFMERPHLNCLSQDDPELVEAIKTHYLHPPSSLPYNFQVCEPSIKTTNTLYRVRSFKKHYLHPPYSLPYNFQVCEHIAQRQETHCTGFNHSRSTTSTHPPAYLTTSRCVSIAQR